jgi:xanthine/CO dehydrogenase XdhC/CoxF family maturation factor
MRDGGLQQHARRHGARLQNSAFYDPPNLAWPFAVYIVTVEVDPETGVWDVLNMVAVDDCGVRINPMIVEGQIMGGLTEAYAMANMQFITFDAEGNCVGSNYMDYLLPTAGTPGFELHSEVVTPSLHHPIGAKGVGECAAVGGPAAFVNAVMDASPIPGCATSTCRFCPTGFGGDHSIVATSRAHHRYARTTNGGNGHGRLAGDGGPPRSLERGEAVALATVVWRQRPSSGQVGSARSSPRREETRLDRRRVRRALGDQSSPRGNRRGIASTASLGSTDKFGDAIPDGMTAVPISCQSEGALEVYIEPVQPVPHLVVVGHSPMAHALADLARGIGWRTNLLDWTEFAVDSADERSMVVVATQGHGDEEAVEQAVAARPAYSGSSARRQRRVRARLPRRTGRCEGPARPGPGPRGP